MDKFIIHNEDCYNIMIVESNNKGMALRKAKKLMEEINKYENFTINDVHKVRSSPTDGDTNIYVNVPSVASIGV